jgi:hypothetical protein
MSIMRACAARADDRRMAIRLVRASALERLALYMPPLAVSTART